MHADTDKETDANEGGWHEVEAQMPVLVKVRVGTRTISIEDADAQEKNRCAYRRTNSKGCGHVRAYLWWAVRRKHGYG